MRTIIFGFSVIFALFLAGCGDQYHSSYTLEFPEIPETWVSLAGEPHWRIEWLNSGGQKKTMDIMPGKKTDIELPNTWVNPVSAWPYWPGRNLAPGLFRPAGALFPFDVSGGRLSLSWEAGLDAVFYMELARETSLQNASANKQAGSRLPGNFNWPRFRELFETDVLNETVRKDPWLVDWRSVAEKTVNSGFDRRRLVPEHRESIKIHVSSGPWYGTSPFASPLFFAAGETPAFPAHSDVDAWISAEGILRCNRKAWTLTPWGVMSHVKN